ncbi:MAG: glycosyltransferase family 4 protein [Clostridia bacterium]|nr:glycosyltransferase family 4 protein [Clostridia bacterium]
MKTKEKLRIAMLGHKRIPSREGGVEIVVSELATGMVSLGHSVTCYNRKGHHVSGEEFDGERFAEYNGVKIKEVFTVQKGGLAAMTSSVFAALKAAFGRYDVVHFHAEGPCAMLWLPKLFGKRCIATIHGLDHQRAKWGRFASRYIRFGEKCAVKFADEIIVLSENVRRYFKETYNRETVFIPNGVNPAQKKEAKEIAAKFNLSKDDYILFLGRLVPEKGLERLIEAYKNVKTDKKLVIAGGSSDTAEFESKLRAASADNPNIIFTGFVQGRLLEELFSNAYFYVLPSDVEGMPLSLLEAMSYGNFCLTSDIPECASVIGKYGCVFDRSKHDDLAEKMQNLCDNPETVSAFRQNSAAYICGRYNWNDVVLKTLELYGCKNDVQAKEELNESSAHK